MTELHRRIPTLLVGCKSDYRNEPDTIKEYLGMDQRLLSRDEVGRYQCVLLQLFIAFHLECSSKTNAGVDAVLEAAIRAALPPKVQPKEKRRRSLFKLFSSSP